MEYESVTNKVLLFVELILYNTKQFQHFHLYFVVCGLKIIGHGIPDNNLKSHRTLKFVTTDYFSVLISSLKSFSYQTAYNE
jgi:hypothetical protein